MEVPTNLTEWTPLGPAQPACQFGDPAATNTPQRHYRLRWPQAHYPPPSLPNSKILTYL